MLMRKRSPDSRTTHLFINLRHNGHLDQSGFAPVAKVVEGWEVISELNFSYREKPKQQLILQQGLPYLQKEFPRLDYIKRAVILP